MGRSPWVRELDGLTGGDVEQAGGKGTGLGEAIRAGFPVPPGFVVTAGAYRAAIERAGLLGSLADATSGTPGRAEGPDRPAADPVALLTSVSMPDDIGEAITAAYRPLSGGGGPARVAVRSSATAEDSATASFAGMNRTFTNVAGEDALLDAVRGCWASLWSARSRTYRSARG